MCCNFALSKPLFHLDMKNTSIPNQIVDAIVVLDDADAGIILKAVIAAMRKQPTDGFQFTNFQRCIFGLIMLIVGPMMKRRESSAAYRARRKAMAASGEKAAAPQASAPARPAGELLDFSQPSPHFTNNFWAADIEAPVLPAVLQSDTEEMRDVLRNAFQTFHTREAAIEWVKGYFYHKFGSRYSSIQIDHRGKVKLIPRAG